MVWGGNGESFFLKKSISFLKENYSFIHPSFGENEGNVVVIIRFSLRYSDGILCVFESRVPFHISQPHIFLEHVYCLFNWISLENCSFLRLCMRLLKYSTRSLPNLVIYVIFWAWNWKPFSFRIPKRRDWNYPFSPFKICWSDLKNILNLNL